MARFNPLGRGAVLVGSLVAHGLLLALLAFPRIEAFADRSNDRDALTVSLERIVPAASWQAGAPVAASVASPVQPRTPKAIFRSPVAPLAVPGRPGSGTPGVAPQAAPTGPGGDLRAALRGSGVGCANETAIGLNRREIERCHTRWGEAALRAPDYAQAPIDPRKRAAFDQVAAGQAAYRRYLESPMAPGVDHRSRDGPGRAKDIPFVMGDTDGIGRQKSDQSLGIKP